MIFKKIKLVNKTICYILKQNEAVLTFLFIDILTHFVCFISHKGLLYDMLLSISTNSLDAFENDVNFYISDDVILKAK